MPNPNGNRLKCKGEGCRSFASKDGWCNRCRPAWAARTNRKPLDRDNYIESYGRGFNKKSFFSGEYGIVRDKCRAVGGDE